VPWVADVHLTGSIYRKTLLTHDSRSGETGQLRADREPGYVILVRIRHKINAEHQFLMNICTGLSVEDQRTLWPLVRLYRGLCFVFLCAE